MYGILPVKIFQALEGSLRSNLFHWTLSATAL